MAALIETGDVQFTYKHLAFLGEESIWAAEASECAADQGYFWAYLDKVYESQRGENRGAFSQANLKGFAKDLGLDTKQFNTCMDSHKYFDAVQASGKEARSLAVKSTPSYVVDGKVLPWKGLDAVIPTIKEAMNQK